MTQCKTVSFKLSEEQKDLLEKKAIDNGLTVSEYIKARLFEDFDSDDSKIRSVSLSIFDKDLISVSIKNYYVAQLLAKKLISEDELNDAITKGNQALAKKGYKTS